MIYIYLYVYILYFASEIFLKLTLKFFGLSKSISGQGSLGDIFISIYLMCGEGQDGPYRVSRHISLFFVFCNLFFYCFPIKLIID